jgi:hypothetical protein
VQGVNGRIHVQKRLVLCNLSELHEKWLEKAEEENLSKVGLTQFSLLRPKHCILAGACGTHTVCVCIHHQNPKLMLQSLARDSSISSLMELAVCSMSSKDCMFHNCEKCPGKEKIEDHLQPYITTDELEFKQWVSTDRCTLVTMKRFADEFMQTLTNDIFNLTKHHYLSKIQAEKFESMKEEITGNEGILQMDFAENFSFIIPISEDLLLAECFVLWMPFLSSP